MADALEQARAALECGDYGRCQLLLAPLLDLHGASTPEGGELRLLLATAQMGQGDTAAAAATCRSLRACRDANLRSQARDLQEVLEAPALQRPREWSMTLPSLGEMEPLEGQVRAMARRGRRRRLPEPPPPPPPGATRAPVGVAVVVGVALEVSLSLTESTMAEVTFWCEMIMIDITFRREWMMVPMAPSFSLQHSSLVSEASFSRVVASASVVS